MLLFNFNGIVIFILDKHLIMSVIRTGKTNRRNTLSNTIGTYRAIHSIHALDNYKKAVDQKEVQLPPDTDVVIVDDLPDYNKYGKFKNGSTITADDINNMEKDYLKQAIESQKRKCCEEEKLRKEQKQQEIKEGFNNFFRDNNNSCLIAAVILFIMAIILFVCIARNSSCCDDNCNAHIVEVFGGKNKNK